MADHARAELARCRREMIVVTQAPADEQVLPPPDSGHHVEQDDTLVLLVICCHPSLRPRGCVLGTVPKTNA